MDSIAKCDMIEFFTVNAGMKLMVKKPGTNIDCAIFLCEYEVLGRYGFYRQVNGIYCGTNSVGLAIYRLDEADDMSGSSRTDYCAINEMGKIEHVIEFDESFSSGIILNHCDISYGENGKQESVECGLFSIDELETFYRNLNEGDFAQYSFLFEDVYMTFEYKYDTATERIEKAQVHSGLDENDEKVEGEYSFQYSDSKDDSFLEHATCWFMDGEGEHTAQIYYNRDNAGNLMSIEVRYDN